MPNLTAVAHGPRASIVVRLGGGHFEVAPEELRTRLEQALVSRLSDLKASPGEFIEGVVAWLEEEVRQGLLQRAYVTASLVVAVANSEVWTWDVGAHGVVRAVGELVSFESSDVRLPALRAAGLMAAPGFRSTDTAIVEKASSVFCIGTPDGYEELAVDLKSGGSVAAFDRGGLPFGPWPAEGVDVPGFWGLDAAWKHGADAHSVVVTSGPALVTPEQWLSVEIPFG